MQMQMQMQMQMEMEMENAFPEAVGPKYPLH
jgi:hypothetical protein